MESVEKSAIQNRLNNASGGAEGEACVSTAAYALRDALRIVLKADPTKMRRGEINDRAYREMWKLFEPIVERVEKLKEKVKQAKEPKNVKEPAPTFQGYTEELDDLVDPNYKETVAGKRIRDSWLWAGFEFRRITTAFPDGSTVMDFSKAKTPPPTDMAIGIAESYGRLPPKERRALYDKMPIFAVKSHTPKDDAEEVDTSEADAILAALEED